MGRRSMIAVAVVAGSLIAGCGGAANDVAGGGGEAPPAAGMCAPDAPDCVDTVVDPTDGAGADVFDSESAKAAAEAMLGVVEADLAADVRVARRGEESFFLTEDYRLGRMTVELDDVDGTFVVTAVTVELPEGPVTFNR